MDLDCDLFDGLKFRRGVRSSKRVVSSTVAPWGPQIPHEKQKQTQKSKGTKEGRNERTNKQENSENSTGMGSIYIPGIVVGAPWAETDPHGSGSGKSQAWPQPRLLAKTADTVGRDPQHDYVICFFSRYIYFPA